MPPSRSLIRVALQIDVFYKSAASEATAEECRSLIKRIAGVEAAEIIPGSHGLLHPPGPPKDQAAATGWKSTLKVDGMTCQSCVHSIHSILSSIAQVDSASIDVSLENHSVAVVHGGGLGVFETIKAKIDDMGFEVLDSRWEDLDPLHPTLLILVLDHITPSPEPALAWLSTTFSVDGMECASCVSTLTSLISKIPGVDGSTVVVTLLPQAVRATHERSQCPAESIKQAIEDAGFGVLSFSSAGPPVSQPVPTLPTRHTLVTTKLFVSGMTCASCVSAIEGTMRKVVGVEEIAVSLLSHEAIVKHYADVIGVRDLIEDISQLGYPATLQPSSNQVNVRKERDAKDLEAARRQVLYALVLVIPTFVISMVVMMLLPEGNPAREAFMHNIIPGLSVSSLVLFLLATPVQFWLGYRFYRGAYKSIRYTKVANMDVLVALGTSAAYFYSIYSVALSVSSRGAAGEVEEFFETSVFLIFFILLGKYMEIYSKGRTSDAITKLLELTPESATLVTLDDHKNGVILEEKVIDVGLVQVGDVLKVQPGDRVPCDGVVVHGQSFVDESMLTGESIPVARSSGDRVMAGTVNQSERIFVKTVGVGADTAVARIAALVQEAQMSQAPIQAIADQVSMYFVPAVVILAIGTFVTWYALCLSGLVPDKDIPAGSTKLGFALRFCISVLVIACPCALGLATPTAVMVGTGVAASHGILIKGGGYALQKAHDVSVIAFDKTGTLTYGKPRVKEHMLFPLPQELALPAVQDQGALVWQLLGLIEARSEHPLAKAVSAFAQNDLRVNIHSNAVVGADLVLSRVTEVRGKGLVAELEVSGQEKSPNFNSKWSVVVGNEGWMNENHCVYSDAHQEIRSLQQISSWTQEGNSLVYIGIRKQIESDDALTSTVEPRSPSRGFILGVVGVADVVRAEAPQVIERLHRMGIDVWMITGDIHQTARCVAERLGIPESRVISQVLPEQKALKIRELKQQIGRGKRATVAMAGDGINDSPALAEADVGIAIGSGSDIAVEAAEAILVKSDLHDVLTLFDLSRTTLRRVKLNFAWAFGYNIIGIPVAAGVLYYSLGFSLSPWIAGAAMAFSSVSVVLSSLLLKFYRPPRIQGLPPVE
ncbi:uncharacterized protein BJ171DRAFT_427961 [Polychytrium aggregatum]|uniref:uncharacterized protein n=1 Tax=Polychytrium aggregatum TaxID=110093 RepID=UPI0022FF4311|nr:uncharacterized protein BJ171DRAFT_427961 [Polychytrium aggregatum]KAI9197431.1 hypothetical protein BJ171DRAFT_427961 [Polychytrium aggregatum]